MRVCGSRFTTATTDMTLPIRSLHVLFLLAAGAGAFVLARELAQRDTGLEVVEVVARAGAAAPAADLADASSRLVATPTAAPVAARPTFSGEAAEDPFQKLSWTPAPVVVAPSPPVAPPVPRAPALPFIFVGLIEQGTAQPTGFLARGEELLVVSAGDVLDGTYRVDSMKATEIVITYLPLKERQTIALPGDQK